MSYDVPTKIEAEDFLAAMFKAQFPDRNVGSKRSYHRRRLQVLAAAVTELHAHIASAQDDVMPDTATGKALIRWGDIFGVEKKSATGARKTDALRVYGSVGATALQDDPLTHQSSGLKFALGEALTIPAAGYIDVSVYATSTGSQTRLEAGEVLEFDSTPVGIETRAELQLALDEDGFDEEQEGAYSRRVLDTIGEPSAGGNDADWRSWALDVEGVGQAFVYSNRAGLGSIDIVALHVGTSSRSLTGAERSLLLEALQELGPSQLSNGALRILETVEDAQDVELTITADDFDWDDSTPPTVSSIDAALRKITLSARPSDMIPGSRFCIKGVASTQDSAILTVESLSGANAIILEEWPDVDPAATDIVYAAGDSSVKIRDAIEAHLSGENVYADSDGPIRESIADAQGKTLRLKILAEGIGPGENDTLAYGDWSSGIVRAVLHKIATYTRGVSNANVTTPAADYFPSTIVFPNDAQINLVVPDQILVRKA